MRRFVHLVAAIVLAALPAAAAAAELPARKSGLWEITTTHDGALPGPPLQTCVDARTDDLSRQLTAGAVTCAKQDLRREGERYVAESVCLVGEATAITRTVFTGSFDDAYQAEIHARYAPPLLGVSEARATVQARRLGACPAGQRPGDMTLPNGTTINLFDARDSAPKR